MFTLNIHVNFQLFTLHLFTIFIIFTSNLTESWMVKPVYGISESTEKEFVLHITKVSLALAHVNPPRNFLRWDVSEIREATSKGKNFMFTVVSSSGNSGKLFSLLPLMLSMRQASADDRSKS